MSDKEPLWKSTSNQKFGNCIENGHISHSPYSKVSTSKAINGINSSSISSGNGGGSNGGVGGNAGNIVTRCCFHLLKYINVRRCVAALVLLTVVTIVYYTHYVDNSAFVG